MKEQSCCYQLKKRPGSGMLALSIALCIITSILGFSASKLASIMFSNVHENGIYIQAAEYAQDKVEQLRSTSYASLQNEIKHSLGTTGYFQEVNVAAERETTQQGVKQKDITINIYYGSETTSRATRHIKRSNWNNLGCPIGAILAWPVNSTPADGGVWLICNGQTIPGSYTALRNLVGGNTPDLRGKFLRGFGSVDNQHQAGDLLTVQMDSDPLLTGTFYTYVPQYIGNKGTASNPWSSGYFDVSSTCPNTGPFVGNYLTTTKFDTKLDRRGNTSENHTYKHKITFDNSRLIRTASETRPVNVAVNFIIKAL